MRKKQGIYHDLNTTTMRILFNESYGDILYDTEKRFFIMNWKSSLNDEQYKNFWNVLHTHIVEHPDVKKLIIDQRNIGQVSMQSRAWFLVKWLPKAKKALPLDAKVAILASKHIFHNTGVQYLVQGAKKMTTVNIQLFSTMEEIESWFSS